ncbi:helix-turn-helix domain-containing protein [Micromonospora sp. MSM11]|nr:helix-turn-helix transcriptional regulator [Micromonospora sp. MSM11]MCL7456243.1 helix-turn-helix domain-containing protein [Micromonospora sp. MSM11]
MADDMGSTVPRRQLGRALRELRTEARMTLDGAAEALQCSRQKMWRIETGLGAVRAVDAKAMCELYGATAELTGALTALANETKAKGWWHSYDLAIPDWFEMYVGLESAASRLRGYDESLVPGLFQVPAYTRGVYQNRRDMSDAEFEQVLAVRRQRKALLTRKLPAAPALHSVLYEAVLLRNIGGRSAMAEQLTHLLALAELPNVSIRVLPLAAGAPYGALAGTFMILDFPLRNRVVPDPPVVYCESLTGALYLDRPAEIAAYERTWSSLDALALDEGESKQLLTKTVGEVHNG